MTTVAAIKMVEVRNRNLAAVFEAVREAPGRSRTEIGAAMPFSLQSMTNVTQELIEMGLLAEVEHVGDRRKGNPQRGLQIVARRYYALGVQIRWNSCTLSLVDLDRAATDRTVLPLLADPGDVDGYLAALEDRIDGYLDLHRDKHIWTITVSGPLPLVARNALAPLAGRFSQLDDQRWFRKFWAGMTVDALRQRLAARYDRPVAMLNNSQAAAYAEALQLPRQARLIYLLAGLALGGAYVSGQQINRDFWPQGGEIGLVVYETRTLSALLSASSLRHAVGLDQPQGAFEPALVRLVAERPEAFDGWIDEAAPVLRFLVNFLENAMWPDGIVLGGFLPSALLDRLIDRVGPLTDSVVAADGKEERIMPRLSRSVLGPEHIAQGAAASQLSQRSNPGFADLIGARRLR